MDSVRADRSSLRIDPVMDQRFDGIPTEAVDQDQARHSLISHLVRQGLNSFKKQELMQELFLGKGRDIALLELTNKVYCTHCHRCMTSGHVWCYCGPTLVYANQDPVIKDEATVRLTHDTCLPAGKSTKKRKAIRIFIRTTNKRQRPQLSSNCPTEGVRIYSRQMEQR